MATSPTTMPPALHRQRRLLPQVGLWVMNRAVNPIVRAMLASPARRVLGRTIGLITVPGRSTGRPITLPVSYTRVNERIVVHPAAAAHKTWWRNISPDGTQVELRLEGTTVTGVARTIFENDRVRVEVTV